MRFFGPPHYHPELHTATPVGAPCTHCGELFVESDRGVAMAALESLDPPVAVGIVLYHEECHLVGVIGSLDHQTRGPHVRGTCLDVPPRMTKRQAAIAAVEHFRSGLAR
jgi:hypothetical protein